MKSIYIVTTAFHDNFTGECEIYIGLIPYKDIPKSSILFGDGSIIEAPYRNKIGIEGVYWKRKYAVEHARLEKFSRKKFGQKGFEIKITKITHINKNDRTR
jgi:hypothetical protein